MVRRGNSGMRRHMGTLFERPRAARVKPAARGRIDRIGRIARYWRRFGPPIGIGRRHRRQQRASRAVADGTFDAEIVPVDVPQKKGNPVRVSRDEYPRPDTTVEKLAALKAAFRKDGSVTAGNSSGINDGAAAVVVSKKLGGYAASALGFLTPEDWYFVK